MRARLPVLPRRSAARNRRSFGRRLSFRHTIAALTPLVILILGCEEEALAPQTVAGAYVATTFTVQDTQLRDVLAAGGSLQLNLAASGATTGQLFVPASITGGSDLTASMAGTFRLSGRTVQFEQAADTFVRDMDFAVVGNTLRGAGTFGGAVVTVVLTRT